MRRWVVRELGDEMQIRSLIMRHLRTVRSKNGAIYVCVIQFKKSERFKKEQGKKRISRKRIKSNHRIPVQQNNIFTNRGWYATPKDLGRISG